MAAKLDYFAHIRRESARFAGCLATADRSARVPTCPDWDAADLLWHLTEVQLFWGAIVRERLSDPDAAEAAKPERPDDFRALLTLFDQATVALLDALASTPGRTEVWTWAGDHSVDFVLRRQAHEALIHRLDAELVVGDPTLVDRDLASDGVDEALTIMFGEVPSWGAFTPDGTHGAIATTDTLAEWTIEFGRFVGTGPDSGNRYDLDSFVVIDRGTGLEPVFTARGKAADLDAWLWGRGPVSAIGVDGDRDGFTRFEQIVARGVE
jgi:uncharacterized protein (TIGR03083 family)